MNTAVPLIVGIFGIMGFAGFAAPAAVAATCPTGAADQFAAGTEDQFLPPEEPVSPGPELQSFIEDVLLKQVRAFDDLAPDRTFGHTFSGLPAGIQGATLTMRLRAISGGSENDTINLEVYGQGDTWGWAIFLSDHVGFWTLDTEAVITLDLADLPPGNHGATSVMHLLADGSLDVLVDDDTAVDNLTLELCLDAVDAEASTWGALKTRY